MRRTRRHLSAEQKAEIVRRHLGGKEPISKLADELGVQPGLIHNWVSQVLAQAEKASDKAPENGRSEKLKERRIEQLQAKGPESFPTMVRSSPHGISNSLCGCRLIKRART